MSLQSNQLKQVISGFDMLTTTSSTMSLPSPPSPDTPLSPAAAAGAGTKPTIGRMIPRCIVILYYDGDEEVKKSDKQSVAKKLGVLSDNISSIKVELTADPSLIALFVVFKTPEMANFILRKAKQLVADKDVEFVSAEDWLLESAKFISTSTIKAHTAESAYHMLHSQNLQKKAKHLPDLPPLVPKPSDNNSNIFELLHRQRPQTVDISVNSSIAASTSTSSIFRSNPTTSTNAFASVTNAPCTWGRQPPAMPSYPQSAGPYNPYQQPPAPLGWPPMSAPPYPRFGSSFPSNQGSMYPPNAFTTPPRPANGFFSNSDGFQGYAHPFAGPQQYQPGPRPQQPPQNSFNPFG